MIGGEDIVYGVYSFNAMFVPGSASVFTRVSTSEIGSICRDAHLVVYFVLLQVPTAAVFRRAL